MKILQINSHYDRGGAARVVACLHRRLMEQGVEAYVAYGRGQKTDEANVHMFGNTIGVYFSAFLSRFSGLNGYFNQGATRKLLRLIDTLKPDIIHIHVLHGYYLNVPMLFRYINKNKIPCVWTFHDCHAFTGNCGYFFDCRGWERGCGSCPYLRNYPAGQWFDFTGKMWKDKKEMFTGGTGKIIVTPSHWLRKEVQKSFFGKYPCRVIPNGVNTEKYFYPRNKAVCRQRYGYADTEKLILGIAVGYRDARKGLNYILHTAKELEEEAKVILIGWNKENNRLLQGLTNVRTLENTQDTEFLAEYYSMADVFVIPSLADNYPTTVLEAMACGTPVVGFDVGGIAEQLKEGRGLVVEAGNQQAFTEAVQRVLRKQAGILRGEELTRQIREEASVERMADKYQEVYRELMRCQETGEKDDQLHCNDL